MSSRPSDVSPNSESPSLRSDIAALETSLQALAKSLKAHEGDAVGEGSAANSVDGQISNLRKLLAPVIEATKETSEKSAAAARDTVQSHPFSSVLVAFVTGALAAVLIGRRFD